MERKSCPVVRLDPTGRDVRAEAEVLRAHGPAARVELPGGVRAWSITSYELAKQVLSDPRVSKDAHRNWPAFAAGEIGQDWPLISWVMMDNMTTKDGADHTRLRKPITRAFTPKRIEAMRPAVERATTELLDALEQRVASGEPVDLRAHFAYPLPVRIICDLFGVPEHMRAGALRGGEKTVDTTLTPEEAQANVMNWTEELAALVEYKREHPGDDMITQLIEAQREDPAQFSDSELIGTLFLALGAGSETVLNLLSKAVLSLLTHPVQRRMLDQGRASWQDVVEETLRFESPIAQLPLRFATEDLQYGDVLIEKGDPILIGFGAVGRDPELHGRTAGTFDLLRRDKEHLSFGFGVHFCLGAQLARMEALIALPALFARFPELELAVPVEQLQSQGSFIMNGNLTLPVHLTASHGWAAAAA